MAHWYLSTNGQHLPVVFESKEHALAHKQKMGKVLAETYDALYEHTNPFIKRIINEGLVKNDLQDILFPILSIDEYVPSDPDTDNIVVAFFIKGVPEAVLPFQHFVELSNGVLMVDHGDSDTIKETSVVYVEFDRQTLRVTDIDDLVKNSAAIAGLEPDDFSMRFPHTDKKFPFDVNLLKKYFDSRNYKKNKLAQKQAEEKADKQREKELQQRAKQDGLDDNDSNNDNTNAVDESMVTKLVSLL